MTTHGVYAGGGPQHGRGDGHHLRHAPRVADRRCFVSGGENAITFSVGISCGGHGMIIRNRCIILIHVSHGDGGRGTRHY